MQMFKIRSCKDILGNDNKMYTVDQSVYGLQLRTTTYTEHNQRSSGTCDDTILNVVTLVDKSC